MPVCASFNVRSADRNDGAFIQWPDSTNTVNESTILDNPNINGQSGARIFVTHNFSPGAVGGAYNAAVVGGTRRGAIDDRGA